MANETPRMGIAYPSEFEDPWFGSFEDMMIALDGHDFASFEDRNLFVMGGGTFTWNATTGVLTWAATIELNTPSTGLLQNLAAGSITIADGRLWVVDVTRGAPDTITLASDALAQLDPDDSVKALCIRRGTLLYFCNGAVMDDGDSFPVFQGGAGVLPADRADSFTGNGSTTAFTLSYTPNASCIPQVFKDGLLLRTTDYSVAGTTLTMVLAPLSEETLDVRYWS
jgi:hypothetical protein